MVENEKKFILGLDISTKTIGIALYEDFGSYGKLVLLHHVTPNVKPIPTNKMELLFLKGDIFENDFLKDYTNFNIHKVIIEEPLLRSNNVNTVATLLKFNGIVSRAIYKMLNVVPEYVSSYDARKYAFPELMAIREVDKKGVRYSDKKLSTQKPVLFGGYKWDIDKKSVLWDKVAETYPQINWIYNKKNILTKENFDMADSVCATLGYMKKMGLWE